MTGVRDYIHVVDLAQGHVAAVRKLDENCGLKVMLKTAPNSHTHTETCKNTHKHSHTCTLRRMVGSCEGCWCSLHGCFSKGCWCSLYGWFL